MENLILLATHLAAHLAANVAALFLCWLFAVAAVYKLSPANGAYYEAVMAGYGIGHPAAARGLARTTGALEMLISLAVLVPATRAVGGAAAVVVLAGYAVLMSIQLLRGRDDLDCGCAGPGSGMTVSAGLVLRNLLLCLPAALVIAVPPGPSGFAHWLLSLAAAALLCLLYMSGEQLFANARRTGEPIWN